MKNIKILTVVLLILCLSISYNVIATKQKESTNESELHVGAFGAGITGLKRSGFVISNNGDEPIQNIQWTFSIKSVSNNHINISYSNEFESLGIYDGYMFTIPNINGFGVVTLSITATSSNTGEATESIYGFQIGRIILSKTYILAWY